MYSLLLLFIHVYLSVYFQGTSVVIYVYSFIYLFLGHGRIYLFIHLFLGHGRIYLFICLFIYFKGTGVVSYPSYLLIFS